ncbi:fasciclin domain-containing protein [Aureibacter tunicatorum]|uniref:FAS1 domain-containing protein n=1 Tax=Aureibacter tunicatorum TaxID=866807 RepID=A0AAE3XQD5_9BACT|nr:fasciclin domain-containing protein [Aureibacter tunicatorum]MDR6240798.1 hypothetical protein [Aureibacter tunicatorum]BDD06869.1 hypothetical protein AUTU_43520 [Aureibacter tunicatorum]
MKKFALRNLFFIMIASVLMLSCSNDDDSAPSDDAISSVMEKQYGNSTFAKLFKKSKFYSEFKDVKKQNYDIFIPSDQAFVDAFGQDALDNISQDDINEVIGIHIVKIDESDKNFSKKYYPTEGVYDSGKPVNMHLINKNGVVYADGVQATPDLFSDYGTMYKVDKILNPSNVLAVMAIDPDYSEFDAMMNKVLAKDNDLKSLLNSKNKPFTVFLATNSAVNQYLKSINKTSVDQLSEAELKDIIGRHVAVSTVVGDSQKVMYFTNYKGERSKLVYEDGGYVLYHDPNTVNQENETVNSSFTPGDALKLGVGLEVKFVSKIFSLF